MGEAERPVGGLDTLDGFRPVVKGKSKQTYDLFEVAVDDLEKRQGIKLSFPQPEAPFADTLPQDLTSLGTGLFDYYENALAHWNYVTSLIGRLDAELIPLTARLGYIKASLKKRGVDSGEIEADPEYVECNTRIVSLKTRQALLEPVKGALFKRMQQLSRAVEGVKIDQNMGMRTGNLNRGPRGGLSDHR